MKGGRGRSNAFVIRNCWLCGHTLTSREEIDFFIPGDYTGVCKDHHLKDILSVKGKVLDTKRIQKILKNDGISSNISIKSIQLKKKIKTPNKMRKFLINLFIFVASMEIIIHLPHILNILINKIK